MKRSPASRRLARQAGFTLLEILVVLGILGFIVTMVAPRVIEYFGRAKSDVARVQIEGLATALDLYRLDVGRYPAQEQGLKALLEEPSGTRGWRGPYLDSRQLPDDPWGRPYLYRNPATRGLGYDLFTLGADGAEGGSGEAADVGNWSRRE